MGRVNDFSRFHFEYPVLNLDGNVAVWVGLSPWGAVIDVCLDVEGGFFYSYKFKRVVRCQNDMRCNLVELKWRIWRNYDEKLNELFDEDG